MFGCLAVIGLLILLVFFDVHYFIRIIVTVLYGRLFQKKGKVTDPTVIHGFCFTQDLDLVLKHMNNARFVRELDFARFHFYDRTGVFKEIVKRKTDVLQSATNIRYRRVIPLFSAYKVTSQVIFWDSRSIYLEQKFITNDGFIRAIVLSKQTVAKGEIMEDIMNSLGATSKPEPSEDLVFWMKSMEASSNKLKPPKTD